ncbi:MAG: hypothetical protein DME76_02090 [Verrucomicrobia bacterium]|nr:MAG: hypothetical protein DME76_02090 [Verrucomicrobiota bacterium]
MKTRPASWDRRYFLKLQLHWPPNRARIFIAARTLHLIENEGIVLLDRLDDVSELAHMFQCYIPVIPSGVEESLIFFDSLKYPEISPDLRIKLRLGRRLRST